MDRSVYPSRDCDINANERREERKKQKQKKQKKREKPVKSIKPRRELSEAERERCEERAKSCGCAVVIVGGIIVACGLLWFAGDDSYRQREREIEIADKTVWSIVLFNEKGEEEQSWVAKSIKRPSIRPVGDSGTISRVSWYHPKSRGHAVDVAVPVGWFLKIERRYD